MYPAGVVHVILHGTAPGGEIWETGFWMSNTGVTDASLANALANIIAGTLSASDDSGAMLALANLAWSAYTTWTSVRVYGYTGGSNKAAFVGEYTLTTPINGSGNPTVPNQVCVVLTLRTDLAGRSHRGRMYLPLSKFDASPSAQLTAGFCASVAGYWATAFGDINKSDTGRIVVVSSLLGAYTPVTVVSMDTRLDIQRSRAKQQAIVSSQSEVVAQHGS